MATKEEKQLMRKSASALRNFKNQLQSQMKKTAEVEEKFRVYVTTQEKLFKLASQDVIRYEDIPEYLDKLTTMESNERELELRALEKVAGMSFLNIGKVDNGRSDHSASDPLTSLILDYSVY